MAYLQLARAFRENEACIFVERDAHEDGYRLVLRRLTIRLGDVFG